MQAFNKGWYVVYTKPRHERKVVASLQKVKLDFFLPMTRKLRVWSDRKKYVDEPLFPSYVFVRLEEIKDYFTTLDIDSVLYFVRIATQIAKVSDTIIKDLRMLVEKSADSIEVSSDTIPPGHKMIIKDGVFTGFNCEVVQYKGKEIIVVRIELLQRNILVDMPAEQLMPAIDLC